MSKTATTSVSQVLSGDGFGGQVPMYTGAVTNTSATGPDLASLAAGDNTITPPATAAGVLIVPPVGSTVALKLKGSGADTGFLLDPANPSWLSFTAGSVASFILNAGGTVAVNLLWA